MKRDNGGSWKRRKKERKKEEEEEKTLSGRKVGNSIVPGTDEARRSYSPMYNKI